MARLVESTFGFRPRMTKIAPDFNFPKVLMVVDDYWVPARIDGVTVDFPGGNILLQKLLFLFCTLCSLMSGTWCPPKSVPSQNWP